MSRDSAREVLPPIDERLVMPGSGAEILEGRVLIVPGADPPHAGRHLTLAYLLAAHTAPGFVAAIDMLTRTGVRSDFAPDASIYPEGPDLETGGRRLELIAFEVVSQQSLSISTRKARELSRRGVAQVIAIVLAKNRALTWDARAGRWHPLHPDETIESPCLLPSVPVRALLETASADESVLAALRVRRPELLEEDVARARAEGEDLARTAIRVACTAIGVEITGARAERLDRAGARELREILASLERDRRWPR